MRFERDAEQGARKAPPPDSAPDSAPGPSAPLGAFPTTCWSRLAAADSRAGTALEILAARYWPAVVAWLTRGPARNEDEARDLAQGFFVQVLETDFLSKADPSRGRFRVFLKTALRNFVASEARAQSASKRGGDERFVPLERAKNAGDNSDGTLLYAEIASRAQGPDEALDEVWRAELVASALEAPRQRLNERGQEERYQIFHAFHIEGTGEDYETLAARFRVSRVDVSNHLTRGKALFREELRSRVLETVGSDDDLRAELTWLLADTNE